MESSPSAAPLVIYHGNCDDGFGAAYAAWKRFGDHATFFPGKFEESPPEATGRQVFLVDFSYSAPVTRELAAQAREVIILDHHQTARKNLQPLLDQGIIGGEFDMTRSGATLAWDYFHPDIPRPPLIDYIQDRDIWQLALPHTHAVSMALRSYPQEFGIWEELMHDVDRLIREGEPILRYFQRELEIFKNLARRAVIGGVDVPFVNAPRAFASDLGGALAEGEPFACVYSDGPKGRGFSLRSREGGLNVAEIAEQYGGGGHPRAAGFRQPLEPLVHIPLPA